jgi:hypothetical protein
VYGDWDGPHVGPPEPGEPTMSRSRVRLREIASERRRFAYRRLHVLLTREGYFSKGHCRGLCWS